MKIMVVRNIYPYLRLEFVMSAVINKYSNISWYLTVSKSLIEKQRMNYVLFSLETKSSKFWSVKYTKMRKILASIFFFKKLLIIISFAAKITTLTWFVNGFMNWFPATMFPIWLSHKCRSCDPPVWRYEFWQILLVLWFSDGLEGLQSRNIYRKPMFAVLLGY